jgi:hypothetical protein
MHLQENIRRILREEIGVIKENNSEPWFKTGGFNWAGINQEGKDNFKYDLKKEFGQKIPREFNGLISGMFPRIDSVFFRALLEDIKKGILNQQTKQEFNKHIINYINSLSKDPNNLNRIRKDASNDLSKIKSIVAKPIIKHYINKIVEMIGNSYFIGGMISDINETYSSEVVNKKIHSNSNKIIKELASSISSDTKLKETINSIVFSFISKL